jgi:hypothetical protein
MLLLAGIILTALCAIYVLAPLFAELKGNLEIELLAETEPDRLLNRKAVVDKNLRDLEFEYRMGRLGDADFQRLEAGLKCEAAEILRQLDPLGVAEGLDEKIAKAVAERKSRMASMKIAPWLMLAAVLPLAPAHAQGNGVVEGRLINATIAAKPPAGCVLDVISLAGGMSVLKSSTSDAAGKFRIDGLPTDSPLLVRASFESVNYFGQASFDAAGRAQIEIKVYETTGSMQGITVEEVQIAFKLEADGLHSLESYTLQNDSRPPRSYMRADGNFRFSKAPGILQVPALKVTGPGGSAPVSQSALESPDGQSYYSLYPLRPGTTSFEVAQALPYQNGSYIYRKKFYQDMPSLNIGVIPGNMKLSGAGIHVTQENEAQNYTLYAAAPVKAGTEVVWTFSGGTPVADVPEATSAPEAAAEDAAVQVMPTPVAQKAIVIGPLVLLGFLAVLWYAYSRTPASGAAGPEVRARTLKEHRERLLNQAASLDLKHESRMIGTREYQTMREQAMQSLRRIFVLLAEKKES